MCTKFITIVFCFLSVLHTATYSQKVGLVLSGGGATGFSHIGVLKALEEAEIPIDYITGTSMGAFIGALYAVGYSPDEIEQIVLSYNFDKINSLETPKEERFLQREKEVDASLMNFKIAKDNNFKKSLPTNFITPSTLDYMSLELLGIPSISTGKDFDSLFIPFRCVASDIVKKESVVFKTGDLNAAVRASMTYPFYINPIRINNKLLFDGGLYNNFPANILYNDFPVDYIIGSNVSSEEIPPSEDDIISQISTMFEHQTNYSLPCEMGLIIKPKSDIRTFDFGDIENISEAIEHGYIATKKKLDSILLYVDKRINKKELAEKRKEFRRRIKDIQINEINVSSYNSEDVSFIENNFIKDSSMTFLTFSKVKKRFFKMYATQQIKYIYPTLSKKGDSAYVLNLDVTQQKPFSIDIGGHFTSRPVNTGYIGLSYYELGKGALSIHGESYFGKFYGSTKLKADYDFPTLFPIRFSTYFILNRWDYFRSYTAFFEDATPPFLLQKERYYGINFSIPSSNNGKLTLDFRKFENNDQYYQILDFSKSDTADITKFKGESIILSFERNTLNRKQWASEGALFKMKIQYIQGKEKSLAGTTQSIDYDLRKFHNWMNFTVEGQNYFKMNSFFKIGIYGKAALNSNMIFSNYRVTTLTLPDFSPLPDAQTLFLEEYRALQYAGVGINLIFNIKNFLEFRFDPYYFQPFKEIIKYDNDSFGYSNLISSGLPMIGASLIFHSPIGPLRFSTNWFPKQKQPLITQLSFGYVIFNSHSIR